MMSTSWTETLEAFARACAAAGPLSVHIARRPENDSTVRSVSQPYLVLGADWRADVALPDERVGRRHAYLQILQGRVFCADLDSKSGVRWPEGPRTAGWLTPGQTIRLGPYFVSLLGPPVAEDTPSDRLFDPLRSAGPAADTLVPFGLEYIYAGPDKPEPWKMGSTLALVGSSELCQVRLPPPTVSRVHCSLVRTPLGVWVVDLLAREGVRLNGQSVRLAQLHSGDELQIGRFSFRVQVAPVEPPSTQWFPSPLPLSQSNQQGWQALPMVLEGQQSGAGLALASDAQAAVNLLMPVMGQFRLMHQQFFDQLRQMLLVLAGAFKTVQGEHAATLQAELDRLDRLYREMAELRAELTRLRRRHAVRQQPGGIVPNNQPVRAVNSPPRPEQSGQLLGAARAQPAAHRPAKPVRPPAAPPADGLQADAELHAVLTQRLAALQQEQESGWQRVFNFFLSGLK